MELFRFAGATELHNALNHKCAFTFNSEHIVSNLRNLSTYSNLCRLTGFHAHFQTAMHVHKPERADSQRDTGLRLMFKPQYSQFTMCDDTSCM